MKWMGIRFGVDWIARNDEPSDLKIESVCEYISVHLLADLTGKSYGEIATKVIKRRKELNRKSA